MPVSETLCAGVRSPFAVFVAARTTCRPSANISSQATTTLPWRSASVREKPTKLPGFESCTGAPNGCPGRFTLTSSARWLPLLAFSAVVVTVPSGPIAAPPACELKPTVTSCGASQLAASAVLVAVSTAAVAATAAPRVRRRMQQRTPRSKPYSHPANLAGPHGVVLPCTPPSNSLPRP